jgi:hypothetical protein
MKRFAYTIFLITCIFFFPWWVVFVFGFFGAIMFPLYIEIILIGITYDILFYSSNIPWYYYGRHTFIALAMVTLSVFIFRVIRK